MSRPKITGITVKLEFPNGKEQTVAVDPNCQAIFFDVGFGKEVLGNFYTKHNGKTMKYTEMVRAFGKKIADEVLASIPTPAVDTPTGAKTSKGTKAIGTNVSIPLNQDVINQILEGEDEGGLGVAFVTKTPPCIII